MKKCDCCGRELGQYDDFYLVNDGLPGERYECYDCHVDKLENGSETSCECCLEYFDYENLKVNPENGIKELCPYCGKVWCE